MPAPTRLVRPRHKAATVPLTREPHWYKDAVIYELHVRSFADSTGDGMGDFSGLTQHLGYLSDLGVTAVWLLPFYPSPLRDDGYDIADYTDVHPSYGTLHDFKAFLAEAHERGIRVITELVVNHTSDQHPWFQKSRRAPPGSPARDYYVWSDTPEKYKDARIIFKDFEASNWSWDPVAKAYYWHRFYSHQPDLNFDNPAVQKSVVRALDFWLGLGVDGLRLDAVPYLYERDGTNCENLPETHAFLKKLRKHVDEKYGDKMLLAEANQWPEDAAAYFGAEPGDEVHTAFHFPLMPRLFMGLRTEDRFPIVDILEQTPRIPATSQWLLFLRNHDELTLEMVTDEERDYMYRVFAEDPRARINLGIRRRLAPLLGNDRSKIEIMNGLLFSLPGTPVLYYGDEIGMGDNIYLGDRNGVRTPMQWSPDRNAGFSRANPQRLFLPVIIDPEYHHEAVNVEAQVGNPNSLLWWTRQLIATRKRYRAFGRGTLEFVNPENRKVLAFVRALDDEMVLVVANLSRHAQHVQLPLTAYKGRRPIEVSSGNPFPPIDEKPYSLAIGSHTFYWFALESPEKKPAHVGPARLDFADGRVPHEALDALLRDKKAPLEAAFIDYLRGRRWFRGKARTIRSARVIDTIPAHDRPATDRFLLLRVEYTEGEPETYVLLLDLKPTPENGLENGDAARIADVGEPGKPGQAHLVDAIADPQAAGRLLDNILRRRKRRGENGDLIATLTSARRANPLPTQLPAASAVRGEQSNTSIVFGEELILKVYRVLESGENPDLEIGRFLTERTSFPQTPLVVGALEYRPREGPPATVAILHRFVRNEGDAWRYTLDVLQRYFERVLPLSQQQTHLPEAGPATVIGPAQTQDKAAREHIGLYLESARLLGQRTAELHRALAADAADPAFAPEPFSILYQRSVNQAFRTRAQEALQSLRRILPTLPDSARPLAAEVLAREAEVARAFDAFRGPKLLAKRIRIHGDYHLGQVLFTGKDFVIIDFEGEPRRPLSERRIKRSPLRDVAGMLRSFHYAVHTALEQQVKSGLVTPEVQPQLQEWADFWYRNVSAAFLHAYLGGVRDTGLVPTAEADLENVLHAFLLDKALYEVEYELNTRPEWTRLPLLGILQLLGPRQSP